MLRHPLLLRFFCARGFSEFAYTMAGVALGWQVYAKTHSAFALGMIGLAQFIPSALLVFVAGHAADRFERKRVVQVCQAVQASVAALLAWGSFADWLTVPEIFAAVALFGIASSFEDPAGAALLPAVVPDGMLSRATALFSSASQIAAIAGPAVGGLVYAVTPGAPYALMAVFWAISSCFNGTLNIARATAPSEPPTFKELFAGVGFVRHDPAILGTISLDLFAVLLGGATALLPIFARDILHTGAWGLGVLRSAPAIGALLMTFVLARRSMSRQVGVRMFGAVIIFGAATIAFALSHVLWLSVAVLAVMGAADTISVVIRSSLVQLRTPDAMRGRVSAVNYLFVNASNQLGEFESGITAALFGAVPAALIGGAGTIIVALLWMRLFPTLRDVQRLEGPAVSG